MINSLGLHIKLDRNRSRTQWNNRDRLISLSYGLCEYFWSSVPEGTAFSTTNPVWPLDIPIKVVHRGTIIDFVATYPNNTLSISSIFFST